MSTTLTLRLGAVRRAEHGPAHEGHAAGAPRRCSSSTQALRRRRDPRARSRQGAGQQRLRERRSTPASKRRPHAPTGPCSPKCAPGAATGAGERDRLAGAHRRRSATRPARSRWPRRRSRCTIKAPTAKGRLTIRRQHRAHVRERVRQVVRHRVPRDGASLARREDDVEHRVELPARSEPRHEHDDATTGTRRRAGARPAASSARCIVGDARSSSSFALGVGALSAAWLAGYKVPLASGATYLRVHEARARRRRRPFGRARTRRSSCCSSATTRARVSAARAATRCTSSASTPSCTRRTILDIPRDTCWDGDKINAANAARRRARAGRRRSAGSSACRSRYVVDVDFAGFQGLVDGVGGVNMNIPTEMHDTYSGAYFQPGRAAPQQHAALAFSRDRHDFPQSDIIRTNNQGLLIMAAIAQLQTQAQTRGRSVPPHHAAVPARAAHQPRRQRPLPPRSRHVPHSQRLRSATRRSRSRAATASRSASDAPGMFADFRDDAVLESH